jgi:hypothetical protein
MLRPAAGRGLELAHEAERHSFCRAWSAKSDRYWENLRRETTKGLVVLRED